MKNLMMIAFALILTACGNSSVIGDNISEYQTRGNYYSDDIFRVKGELFGFQDILGDSGHTGYVAATDKDGTILSVSLNVEVAKTRSDNSDELADSLTHLITMSVGKDNITKVESCGYNKSNNDFIKARYNVNGECLTVIVTDRVVSLTKSPL